MRISLCYLSFCPLWLDLGYLGVHKNFKQLFLSNKCTVLTEKMTETKGSLLGLHSSPLIFCERLDFGPLAEINI
jgi:hypothetical protein